MHNQVRAAVDAAHGDNTIYEEGRDATSTSNRSGRADGADHRPLPALLAQACASARCSR